MTDKVIRTLAELDKDELIYNLEVYTYMVLSLAQQINELQPERNMDDIIKSCYEQAVTKVVK